MNTNNCFVFSMQQEGEGSDELERTLTIFDNIYGWLANLKVSTLTTQCVFAFSGCAFTLWLLTLHCTAIGKMIKDRNWSS